MATAKQRAAARRNIKKAQAARRSSLNGFAGLSLPSFDVNLLMNALKNAGLTLAGFMVGREATRKFIKVDEGDTNKIKKYLGGAIQLGGGLILTALNKGDEVKYLGIGMTASGALDLVEKLSNKDFLNEGILSGLQGLGSSLAGGSVAPFLPELQRLAAQDYIDDVVVYDDIELVEE